MSKPMPPVPPAGRTDKGPGTSGTRAPNDDTAQGRGAPENLGEQDRQGNIKQNTTHQGHQQDR